MKIIRQHDRIILSSHCRLGGWCANNLCKNPRFLNWNRGFFVACLFLTSCRPNKIQAEITAIQFSPASFMKIADWAFIAKLKDGKEVSGWSNSFIQIGMNVCIEPPWQMSGVYTLKEC